jgi:hypothetical protein
MEMIVDKAPELAGEVGWFFGYPSGLQLQVASSFNCYHHIDS